ncbi:MAG: hypothetical protein IPM42_02595 [Saprospiraceae bacterium]|nr:hypothetical protein [Saprospiraceae bacterium]
MKYFICFTFIFISSFLAGQTNIEYVSQQLENVEKELQRHDKTWILNNIQKEQMMKIFQEKFRQVEAVWNSGLDKRAVSEKISKIEEEFKPKVESLLTTDQRLALIKSGNNKKSIR